MQHIELERDDILDTWKGIASYLGRDVRTVQRWERTRNLPVHRLPGIDKAAVFARKSELERWRNQTGTVHAVSVPSVAVLPLESLNADDLLSFGFADGLIHALAGLEGIQVLSRNSSFTAARLHRDVNEIGRALQADAVVTGTIQASAGTVCVRIRLLEPTDRLQLWFSERHFVSSDLIRVQEQIARVIQNCLTGATSAPPQKARELTGKVNLAAYNAWAKGRYLSARLNPPDMAAALRCFEESIDLQPAFVSGLAGMAEHRLQTAVWGFARPAEELRAARAAALETLSLDPTFGEAHAVLGACSAILDFDWVGSENAFTEALRWSPSSEMVHRAYAVFCLEPQSRFEEAERELVRVIELDPLSANSHAHLGHLFMIARRYGEARNQLVHALQIDPRFRFARWVQSAVNACEGRHAEVTPVYEEAAGPGLEFTGALGPLGYTYARLGRESDARKLLEMVLDRAAREYVPPLAPAWIYLGLGEFDQCFRWLRVAIESREPQALHLPIKPIYDDIRTDRRFGSLLACMRLSTEASLG